MCVAGSVVAMAGVSWLALPARACRRSLLRRFRSTRFRLARFGLPRFGLPRFGLPRFGLLRRDPLAPLVRTARSLNYGAGEFLGPVDADDDG